MTIRDLNDEVDVALSLSPAARVNGTFNGTAGDLRGYDSAAVVVAFGAYTDGTHTPSFQYSDDGVSFTTPSASEISGAFAAVSSGAGANTVQRVGHISGHRYVRAVLTGSGATTGALSEMSVLRGNPARAPLA